MFTAFQCLKDWKELEGIPLELPLIPSSHTSQFVGPSFRPEVIITMSGTPAQPSVNRAQQSYDRKVQRSEDLALDAVTELVPYRPLPLVSQDDVPSKGYSTTEVLGIVEGDAVQGVPLLSTNEEEKQQSEEVLR